MSANVRHSSESVEHFTPIPIVEAARSVMGGIDLDPASCATANREIVRADRYFDEAARGHAQPWPGRVFLNPPGGRIDREWKRVEFGGESSAKRWWCKMVREWLAGRLSQGLYVGFSLEQLQTTQVQEEDALPTPLDFPLCYPSRRIAYLKEGADGAIVRGKSPPHASFIAFLPPARTIAVAATAVALFEEEFGSFGRVVIPRELLTLRDVVRSSDHDCGEAVAS